MYKEYRIKINKTVFDSVSVTGRPRTPGFRYDVFAESDTSHDRLASVDNKAQYYALDEALEQLLMLLAVRNEQAIVKVVHYTSPLSIGAKQLLTDKYATETQFASLTL